MPPIPPPHRVDATTYQRNMMRQATLRQWRRGGTIQTAVAGGGGTTTPSHLRLLASASPITAHSSAAHLRHSHSVAHSHIRCIHYTHVRRYAPPSTAAIPLSPSVPSPPADREPPPSPSPSLPLTDYHTADPIVAAERALQSLPLRFLLDELSSLCVNDLPPRLFHASQQQQKREWKQKRQWEIKRTNEVRQAGVTTH